MKSGAAAIRAAIIDLDGTMLHTVPDFELALNGMRAEFKLAPITQDIIEPMVGKGSEKLIRDVLALDYDAAPASTPCSTRRWPPTSATTWPSTANAPPCSRT
jgi:phosphoglycolate phosphatase-like HAD superfamily hydrolase